MKLSSRPVGNSGYNISQISKARGPDRKTVRHYINISRISRDGLSREHPLPEKEELLKQLQAFLPQKEYDQHHPKDKGKVEHTVPLARELFRNPEASGLTP
jgi:hypothetical protein